MTTKEFIKQAYKQAYKMKHLLETTNKDHIKDYNVGSFIDKKAAEAKWGKLDKTLEGQKKILSAAYDGDSLAQQYVFYKLNPIIADVFWKKFLGVDYRSRNRKIKNGAWFDWIGMCWETLFGSVTKNQKRGIDFYNSNFTEFGSAWSGLASKVKPLLTQKAIDENTKNMVGGMSGIASHSHITDKQKQDIEDAKVGTYDPIYNDFGIDEEGNDLGTESVKTYLDDYINDEDDLDSFWSKWRYLSHDPELRKPLGQGGKTNFAEIISDILKGKDQNEIALKYGISKGSMSLYVPKLVALIGKYNINSEQFYKALNDPMIGPNKLGKALLNPSNVNGGHLDIIDSPKKSLPYEKVRTVNSKSFKQRFSDAFDESNTVMWKGQHGTNPANILCTALMHPRFDINRIAKEHGIRPSLADTYLQRAYDALEEAGISREELDKNIKKYSGDKLANLIGDPMD